MKALIIGLGSIAKQHIRALKKIDSSIKIYALRSKKASSKDGITNLYSFDEASNIDFNFAIISNPTAIHKTTIEQLVNFNIPLFIEKPLSHTLEISKIVDEINSQNIFTYVACNLRFHDSINYVKNFLLEKSPVINEVNVYCGSYLPEWRSGQDYKRSYSSSPELGGGVHLDLIHEFDYIYWFFGLPQSVRKTLKNNSSLEIKAVDYANYLLDYEDFCVGITLNYFRKDYKRTLEIVFKEETWNVDLAKNTIKCNNKTIFQSEQSFADTYLIQMQSFINSISKNEEFNSAANALDVLKMCLNNE